MNREEAAAMDGYVAEQVEQAKRSFNRILDHEKYAGIIRDDAHLSLLLSLVEDGAYNRILDIGTGTGYLAFPLAETFPAAHICGIDIAETIIEKNNAAVKERGITNLNFEAFDGLAYPFPSESFDLIVTRYAFHHFPNAANAVRQMNWLLVRGGKVLVSDPMKNEKDDRGIIDAFMRVKRDGHNHFNSSDELDKLFTSNGFVKEKQVLTEMRFPFPQNDEYIEIYQIATDGERELYGITNEDGVVWVNHIDVGNTVFVKR